MAAMSARELPSGSSWRNNRPRGGNGETYESAVLPRMQIADSQEYLVRRRSNKFPFGALM